MDEGSPLKPAERLLEGVARAIRAIHGEGVRLRAMALTYISLFALVPALVVAFSVVQAFTGMERISGRVHELLLDNLAVGARTTLEPYLDRFTQNAHLTGAGLVGGAILIWSAVSLFSNVERAVNDLWGIRRRRSLIQQATIYWTGLTVGPLLLAGSATVSELAQSFLIGRGIRALAVVAAGLLSCAFLTTLYITVPNTRVKWRAALTGGVAAGIAWELAKWLFATFVAKSVRYHAIYGSVAAVPIFLTWLYVSWTILLFGARLAYVVQYASAVIGRKADASSSVERELLADLALLEVARAFDRGEPAPELQHLVERLRAEPDDAAAAVTSLREGRLLAALASGGLVPARALEHISLLDVRHAVTGNESPPGDDDGRLVALLRGADGRAAEQLRQTTFRDLCDQERGEARATASLAGTTTPTEGDEGKTGIPRG